MPKHIDETGKLYGELTVISLVKGERTKWKCKCSCGNETLVTGWSLRAGKSKSCGKCGKTRAATNPIEPIKRLFRSLRTGAKRRGLTFELKFEQFVEISKLECHYCGQPPEIKFAYSRKRYSQGVDTVAYANGVDRIDSSIGYIEGNMLPCCRMCNTMKMDQTLEEFYERIRRIYERKKITESRGH